MGEPASTDAPRPAPIRGGALGQGATVQLVAPSSAFDPRAFAEGVSWWESRGFRVVYRSDIADRAHYLAGPARRRVAEIHQAFEDPDVDAVVAVRGGTGCQQLLPSLDFDLVRRHPKPLVGCSDLTVLLNALADRTGLVSLHGPMAAGLPGRVDEPSQERLLAALTRSERLPPLQARGDAYWHCLSPGVARGRACGGSLTMVAASCGTPWQVDTRGAVVFLEDVGERAYRIDRMLQQVRQAGLFDHAVGIAFGEFVDCPVGEGASYGLRDVVSRCLRDLPLAMVWDLPFGHGATNLCFPIGAEVEIDAGAGTVAFREPLARRRAGSPVAAIDGG